MRSGQPEEHGVKITLTTVSVANVMTENKPFCSKMEQCLFREMQYGTNASLRPRCFCLVIDFVATTVRACTCVSMHMWVHRACLYSKEHSCTQCVRVFVCGKHVFYTQTLEPSGLIMRPGNYTPLSETAGAEQTSK